MHDLIVIHLKFGRMNVELRNIFYSTILQTHKHPAFDPGKLQEHKIYIKCPVTPQLRPSLLVLNVNFMQMKVTIFALTTFYIHTYLLIYYIFILNRNCERDAHAKFVILLTFYNVFLLLLFFESIKTKIQRS